MAVTTTNLGVITAYGDAVAAGYTGTKAEWQALMASYATVGQQAVDAKNDAVAAKNTAVSKATEATTAASTATTKANEASASAQSIAQSAAQIQENTDDIDQLKSDLTFCGVQSKVIRNAYLNSSGVIVAGSWDTYCYRVASGQKINSIELGADSQQLIFAYYADEPSIGSVSYNNSRIPMGSGIITAKDIFVPKSDSINWIAIRCATSDNPIVEFENVGDVNNAIIFRGITGITDVNSISDTSVRYISSSNASNLPANGAWYLMSMRHDSNNHLQLAYKAQGTETYIRAMVAGTWSDWQSIGSELITALENKSFTRNSNSGITDANSITNIGYSYLSANTVSNLPASGAWYVWTVSLDSSNFMQLAYNARGTNPYIRAKVNGTWGAWERIGKESVDELAVTSSIAMFPTVGCCGDSFTAGYLYNKPESQWYDPNYVPNGEYPAIGYPAVMGRLYGIDVTAYAKGGLTTTAYRTDTKGLPALINDTAKDLYIIALGLNDKTQDIPMGVETDIDTEPASATYLGNMGAIIRAIQTHAPMAKIILCKSLWVMNAGATAYNSYYQYISEGVELLSNHLGIPYLETLNDPYFCSRAYVDGLKGLHPTAPLYAGMGKRIGELVGKCVIDNPAYFYNFYVPNA